ncbi:MAG TPA: FliI/YscN family ATPase [Desulfosalsimonadaceae bacterium]|nr:FliI/YscN family ATPase [Desulfosalsimonadaceae bacterium]
MEAVLESISRVNPVRVRGKVSQIVGLVIEGCCPRASLGSLCEILPAGGGNPVPAEVVGFKGGSALLMPLGEMHGLGVGSLIRVRDASVDVDVGREFLGRVVDALARPVDGKGPIRSQEKRELYHLPPSPMARSQIAEPLDLGVRSINGLLTCGMGQRMGIMAGSGVGKSVLLGMMARNTRADVNVIALIGERGREVREFIEDDLGSEGLSRSVVVTATSDQSPLLRMRGAFTAMSLAEYYCSQGKNVLMMMDSVTRFAMAIREIGLAVGEPPTTKGYTPSVFARLPKLLERAGSFSGMGSITGLFTVLVEGDDMNEPVADAVRSILDGHITLSRDIAAKNHYPAVDVLNSTSRVMQRLVDADHSQNAAKIREILATYAENEDLINIGAYKKGSNPKIDHALSHIAPVNQFLRQDRTEQADMEETRREMEQLFGKQ